MQLLVKIMSVAFSWVLLVFPGNQPGTARQVVAGNGSIGEYVFRLPEEGDIALSLSLPLRGGGARRLVVDESLGREIVITGDWNILDCIAVEEDEGLWTIGGGPGAAYRPTRLTVAVGAPVRELVVNGAWDIAYGCPSVTDCRIEINGACTGGFAFGALDSLQLNLNGASSVALAGAARSAALVLNGASLVEAFDLTVQGFDLTVNGAGDLEITAEQSLRVTVNGIATIACAGDPAIRRSVNGLASIQPRDLEEEPETEPAPEDEAQALSLPPQSEIEAIAPDDPLYE